MPLKIMENIDEGLVKFTSGALKQLEQLSKSSNPTENKIRIGVEGGGCAGLNYILRYDEEKQGDLELDVEGLKIIMNKAHSLYLAGITVDFKDGLDARGFTFENPNAKTTCGCGSSFGI